MIKFKEFNVGDADYKEQMEQFQTEHQNAEFVQITGGHMSYEKIWFKYEPSDTSATTDKLSVEKLQEHLLPYKKETVQKIIDEKMQLVTADEFLKLHKESLTAIRENDKLQEQLNTAKKALTESEEKYQKQMDRFLNSEMNESARSHCESQLKLLFPAHKAYEVLAAIGGDDEKTVDRR